MTDMKRAGRHETTAVDAHAAGGLDRRRESEGHPLGDNVSTALGHFVMRFRYLSLLVWILGTVLAVRALPSLSSVSNNNNSSFLPKNIPSLKAAQLASPFALGVPCPRLCSWRRGAARP